jgi:ABC-type nitrate/sulfonate/bicarbonate transport system permease component
VGALSDMVGMSSFWSAVWSTLRSWAIGFAVSAAVAIPVGLLIGSSQILYRTTRVGIDVLRSLPPVAIIPLALLLYGATDKMAFFIIVTGSVWPILLQSIDGARQVHPIVRDVARSYHVGRGRRSVSVVLPSASPYIATGMRIAATMSLLLAIGAELIGGAPGLGLTIVSFQLVGDAAGVFAVVVVTALMGVAVNVGMLSLERRLLRWHPSHRAAVFA